MLLKGFSYVDYFGVKKGNINSHFISLNFEIYLFTYHGMNDTQNRFKHQSIIVKLGKIHIINYMEMLLMDKDARSYSYYIDVSLDGIEYKRLID